MKEWNKDALVCLQEELKRNVIVKNGLIDKLEKAAGGFMMQSEAQAVECKPSNAEQMGELIQIFRSRWDVATYFRQCSSTLRCRCFR